MIFNICGHWVKVNYQHRSRFWYNSYQFTPVNISAIQYHFWNGPTEINQLLHINVQKVSAMLNTHVGTGIKYAWVLKESTALLQRRQKIDHLVKTLQWFIFFRKWRKVHILRMKTIFAFRSSLHLHFPIHRRYALFVLLSA